MFKGNIILDHIEGTTNSFIVKSDFVYENNRYIISVKHGWKSDGASVPKIFWNIFPPISGKYMEAAILHDILYASQIIPRKEADKIFLEAMKELGVSTWKRYIMYYAVRIFGKFAWNEKTDLQINKSRLFIDVIIKLNEKD